MVIISHDRYLLDETVSEIAELEDGRLTPVRGQLLGLCRAERAGPAPSSSPTILPSRRRSQRLEEAIARFKLWASLVMDERHIKQARNKQRQIDRMDKVERPVLERRKMGLQSAPAAARRPEGGRAAQL